jgi:hypothetical protein
MGRKLIMYGKMRNALKNLFLKSLKLKGKMYDTSKYILEKQVVKVD